MARYTTLYKAASSAVQLRQVLLETLASCDLNLIYENDEYLVAKEKPGGVKPAQLATVEMLINPPTVDEPSTKVNLVVKNEELPLSVDNHCHRVFRAVNQALESAPIGAV
ncbi:MAG: hypothetical protein IGR92_00605 [Leptolyngbyaceae cyanobacterium T60_A2020_046]|nr:hypothetical protein [Leptolyngbyaceae cyanobacterium T60_A2020_046]